MDLDDSKKLKEQIEAVTYRPIRKPVQIIDSAENYTALLPGIVLRVNGSDYFIQNDAKEGRFGIEDQPKLWVKHAFDLKNQSRKILKLVFHEKFETKLGMFTIRCERNPEKESRILDAVKDDSRFMQGHTVYDSKGYNIRVIDYIRGKTLYNYVASLKQPHEQYFYETMPDILRQVLTCIEALGFLHEKGEHHGDVRNDHILIEADTGIYRWIDFDYEANVLDFDVWSAGNIISYVVGKGSVTCKAAKAMMDKRKGGESIDSGDSLMLLKHRMVNLRKLYPYIPKELNDLLMRFSSSTHEFYESIPEIVSDLSSLLENHFSLETRSAEL